jgi:hypothetical protein
MARVGNWAWNVQTGEMNGSDENYRPYGYQPGDFTPTVEWVRNCIHPGDLAVMDGFVETVMRDGVRKSIDYRIRQRDGSIRYLTTVAGPDRPGQGRPGPVGLWHHPGHHRAQAAGRGVEGTGKAIDFATERHPDSGPLRRQDHHGDSRHTDASGNGGLFPRADGGGKRYHRPRRSRTGRLRLAGHLHEVPPVPPGDLQKLHRERYASFWIGGGRQVCCVQV